MSRQRWQRGRLERTGKRVKVWKGHWYVYHGTAGVEEKRKHKARVLGECARMTKSEAQKQLDKLIARSTGQRPKANGGMTFGNFYETVYRPSHEGAWARNTKIQYASLMRKHLMPAFEYRALEEIDRSEVQLFLAELAKRVKEKSTVSSIKGLLSAIMNDAEASRFIDRTPVYKIKNPMPLQHKPKSVLTLDQCRHILTSLSGGLRVFYGLLLLSGLRLSEVLALRWNDIGERWLTVDESADAKMAGPVKTRIPREVPLPTALRSELVAMRKAGAKDDAFVFPDTDGSCMWRSKAYEWFVKPAREITGLKKINPQITRRTFATRIKPFADPTDIQAMLGHTKVEMTQKHYIQPVSESQIEASEKLATEILQ